MKGNARGREGRRRTKGVFTRQKSPQRNDRVVHGGTCRTYFGISAAQHLSRAYSSALCVYVTVASYNAGQRNVEKVNDSGATILLREGTLFPFQDARSRGSP